MKSLSNAACAKKKYVKQFYVKMSRIIEYLNIHYTLGRGQGRSDPNDEWITNIGLIVGLIKHMLLL